MAEEMPGSTFESVFGEAPRFHASAPGRVNLIGDHTDYTEGFVLPTPLPQCIQVWATPCRDRFEAASGEFGGPVSFDPAQPRQGSWIDYVVGALQQAASRGLTLSPHKLFVRSDLPAGAGVSSSAALQVAVLRLIAQITQAELSASEIALLAQAAENQYCGVPCGVMDQMVSSAGRPGSALMLDCRSLEAVHAAIPDSFNFVVVHSGVERKLLDSAYDERRSACEAAAVALEVPALRDATLDQLADLADPTLQRRARHVVSENRRVLLAVEALRAEDAGAFGRLMNESHASLRDDFESSAPEVDRLVDGLRDLGAIGARITGGGFGGCAVALMTGELPEGWWREVSAAHPKASLVSGLSTATRA
jgi:galactokinase